METFSEQVFRIFGNLACIIRAEKNAHSKALRITVLSAVSGPSYYVRVSGQEEMVNTWAEEMNAQEVGN
jgi:hypothetical protein